MYGSVRTPSLCMLVMRGMRIALSHLTSLVGFEKHVVPTTWALMIIIALFIYTLDCRSPPVFSRSPLMSTASKLHLLLPFHPFALSLHV